MAIALYFLYRYLRNTLNQCDPSMTYQIMLTALVLSNKSFDDQSYTLKTWSNLLDMDLSILNQLEAHFLNVTNFSLPFNKIDEEFYHTFGSDDQFREFVRSLLSPKEEITTPEVAQPLTISPLLYQPMMKAPVSFPHQVTNLFTPGSSFATPSSTVTGSSESNDEPEVKNSKPTDTVSLQNSESSIDLKWVTAFKDPIIRSMLRSDALQIHLVTIMKILKEPQFTNSTNLEETKEVALLKLTNLRHPNGIEANEIVEEFINRLLLLI
ncbi:uncharacterized protein KQ657_002222 [Scheffersomyces spartinae]|uniref:Cyclin N-terminal domain-containing protein n=1 Tax=Scheffersomyces spartinae TaxID=45513 RepID=A0A9P7VDS9_9ASCO|nr:uncharacterized protein KQ657_002222 [Scheffersomyces spartinae]KAG7195837.1 hypothetical protein KQ657_002222 [Scheffersomyces spartinae]